MTYMYIHTYIHMYVRTYICANKHTYIASGADSVSPEVLASVTDMERKRQEAIFELLTTERHYVDSLKLVQEVFFDPMAQGEVLTEEEMAKVRGKGARASL